ncbi:hypothetical protein CTI12_AA167650 [Artemisia annua]|uniref:DUF7731 domain-containing protein n=1 Tax=Artemisia annua TaxID=35608 RepID=A0A2U1PCR3_ARTAN|nr:hypothetical protein CTI12_AA167650 [Artemisia annua]
MTHGFLEIDYNTWAKYRNTNVFPDSRKGISAVTTSINLQSLHVDYFNLSFMHFIKLDELTNQIQTFSLLSRTFQVTWQDNERAFFDSADWALGKQSAGLNQISTAAIETLQPKLKVLLDPEAYVNIDVELQKTPHQRLPPRRPACVSKQDNHIYSNCEESYRLTQSGNLNVPPDYTDQFCGGACLKETDLVLNCINDVLSNFLFFNRATVRAVKDTIKDGCSFGPRRGDFNVAEHIQSYESNSFKFSYPILFGLVPLISICLLLF